MADMEIFYDVTKVALVMGVKACFYKVPTCTIYGLTISWYYAAILPRDVAHGKSYDANYPVENLNLEHAHTLYSKGKSPF